jgi:hypothetical protein
MRLPSKSLDDDCPISLPFQAATSHNHPACPSIQALKGRHGVCVAFQRLGTALIFRSSDLTGQTDVVLSEAIGLGMHKAVSYRRIGGVVYVLSSDHRMQG